MPGTTQLPAEVLRERPGWYCRHGHRNTMEDNTCPCAKCEAEARAALSQLEGG